MKHKYTILKVAIRQDMVPGWNHNNTEDMQKHVQRTLDHTVGHYHPEVEVIGEEDREE